MLGSASATPVGIRTLPTSGSGLSQGTSGWLGRVEDLNSDSPQGSCHSTWQLERVPSLWLSTCRLQQGERNVDSPLFGGLETGTTLQEGNLAMQAKVLEMCVLMAQQLHS